MKNFCSRVIDDFSKMKWIDHIIKDGVNQIVKDIKSSVHFVLPDGGKIFDDDFKGLQDKELRLPFPKITLEFHDLRDFVIQAQEIHRDQIENSWLSSQNDSEIWIYINIVFKNADTGYWQLFDHFFVIPSKWDKTFDDDMFHYVSGPLFPHLNTEVDKEIMETFGYHSRSLMEFF